MSEEDDRLARWARLKGEAARPVEPAPVAEEEADEAFIAALPKLDEIDAATDIRGFLRKGVPQALQTAALAKVWLADPAIRDRVPDAVDYAEDYNAPHTISGWGPACPDEARSYVARVLDPPAESTPAQFEVEPVEPVRGEADAGSTAEVDTGAASVDPTSSPRHENVPKSRKRHGGALPADG